MAEGALMTPAIQAQPARLLLVDDNPTNLQVLYQTLYGRGYKLLVAKSGEDALAIAAKVEPALMLLDIMMPGIDGFEVCRRLKADPKTHGIAVIFLSALDDSKDKVKGLDVGAVDYISKPFNAEEVIARVETHLKIQRLERSLSRRNQALEAANQKMKADLEAAARVQQALLPDHLPEVEGLRFTWRYRPCDELGGDGLNIFRIDDRHVVMYVLDVCGHGVPSALLAVTVSRSLLPSAERSALVTEPADNEAGYTVASPAEVARRLNRLYPMDFKARLYFTLLYGVLEVQTRRFTFVAAGIPGPMLLRKGRGAESHDVPAVPIGLLEDSEYQDTIIELEAGDRLYLYSDGLVEERNGFGEEYGRERLAAATTGRRNLDLAVCLESFVEEVIAWRGDEHMKDDVSMIALEVLDPAAAG
jgi:sigma-B regulation protein RsbU (phosphoserine phosphatase)